jgi:hypothetical protein
MNRNAAGALLALVALASLGGAVTAHAEEGLDNGPVRGQEQGQPSSETRVPQTQIIQGRDESDPYYRVFERYAP